MDAKMAFLTAAAGVGGLELLNLVDDGLAQSVRDRLDAGALTGMTMTDFLDLIHLHEEERKRLTETAIAYAQKAIAARGEANKASSTARKIFNARVAKVSKASRKHIDKTEAALQLARQGLAMAGDREAAALAKLADLEARVVKDASLVSIMNTHIDAPPEKCDCAVCKMHSMMKDLKAKYKEQKEILKGFQGPKSKK